MIAVHRLYGEIRLEHRLVLVGGGWFEFQSRRTDLRMNRHGHWYVVQYGWEPTGGRICIDPPPAQPLRARVAGWLRQLAAALHPEGCRG